MNTRQLIDDIRAIPLVLWALAFFFLCLGFRTRIDLPLALLAATSVFAFQHHHIDWRAQLQQHSSIILFIVIAMLTTITSHDWRHSVGVQPQLLPALLAYAIICRYATTPQRIRFILISLLASGLLTVSLILIGTHASASDDPLERVKLLGNALFIVPNDILMLSVITPLALAVHAGATPVTRVMIGLYIVLSLFASVTIGSRQATVVSLAGMAFFYTLMKPRWFLPALLGVSCIGLMIDWLLGWPLLDKVRFFSRAYVWHAGWLMFLEHPLLGQGPGAFRDLYFPFLEKAGYVIADLPDRRNMPWAHNLYLEQLAERGIAGLVALGCLLSVAGMRAWQGLRNASNQVSRGVAAGILAALGTLMLAGIAEATLTRLWVTVLLLALAGLCQSNQRALPHSTDAPP